MQALSPSDRREYERVHRSRTMAAVGSTRTDVEQALAHAMWAVGLRGWRRHRSTVGTRPDFVFVSPRVVVFADGCFWHGCSICAKQPQSNAEYWMSKINRNRVRDETQTNVLRDEGWTVFRFWGHEILADPASCAVAVAAAVRSSLAVASAR